MTKLYPYQERVIATLLGPEKKNVILVVPTGGGKTWAAVLPYLQDRAYDDGLLPEKALYAVPMRVLATQFKETCRELIEEELDPALFQELEKQYQRFGGDLNSLQTGETPEDPQLESMIVACTIDQLLASALGIPYSLGHNAANINVGAVCGSYLILDEPHLYPLTNEGRSYKGALTTCLEMLRLLKGLTRFVFMSATMSSTLVERLSEMLDAEVITVDDDELVTINQGRLRTLERSPIPMSAERILQEHDRCSLVVCNTVQQAQTMYLELDSRLQQSGQDTQLKLLHSHFTDEDRQEQGKQLSELLGKRQWEKGVYLGLKDVIVVSTQVVEVGLDISVQTLHTQLSPANSLLQRAGRCARFEWQRGRVIVYPLPPRADGKPASTLPYDAALCAKTWDALPHFEGKPVGFREEQDLVDIVHTSDDLALLQRYEDHRYDLQEAFTMCLRTHEREHASELIRDVRQVQLLIHDNPGEVITTEPWCWQSFGLHPSQFLGKHWEDLRAKQSELDLADAYHYAIVRELGYVMARLEQLMGLQPDTIDHAIQLAIATHDLGKLSREWQRWARAWQDLYMQKKDWAVHYREPASDYFFAKTNYDYRDRDQRNWQKELTCTRPHHACESVKAAENLLAHSLDITHEQSPNLPVLRAVCYAIAHHHTPNAHEYGATSIDPRAPPG